MAMFVSYPGVGERNERTLHYAQAVRVGHNIEISGQGGWDPATGVIYKEINAQIDQAFENVQLALETAGGGWDEVYRIRSYHIPLNREAKDAMVRNMSRWLGHRPLWTCLNVERLGEDDMRVEIEVWARVGAGGSAEDAQRRMEEGGKRKREEGEEPRHFRLRWAGGGRGLEPVEM